MHTVTQTSKSKFIETPGDMLIKKNDMTIRLLAKLGPVNKFKHGKHNYRHHLSQFVQHNCKFPNLVDTCISGETLFTC